MAIFKKSVFRKSVRGYRFEGSVVYISAPIVLTDPTPVVRKDNEEIAFYSITDGEELIIFSIEFYVSDNDPLHGTVPDFIETYNQFTVDSDNWDKPGGYISGEMAVFTLPKDSAVFDYQAVEFRVRALNSSGTSDYSDTYELQLSDLAPGRPEVVDSLDQTFRWASASELPEEANDLLYQMQFYSLNASALSFISSVSYLSAFSGFSHMNWLDGLSGNFGLNLMSVLLNTSHFNEVSYNQALSAMLQGGFMDLFYTTDWIGGQYSNTNWQVLSAFSVGSYLMRVGAMDNDISGMIWSLFGAFDALGGARTITFKPGFNLYSIPLKDEDADTARKLVERKAGYKYTGEPYLTEVIRWKEEGSSNDKWESVAASRIGYDLTNDFDLQPDEGYFINLNSDEPIAINFRGDKWL